MTQTVHIYADPVFQLRSYGTGWSISFKSRKNKVLIQKLDLNFTDDLFSPVLYTIFIS